MNFVGPQIWNWSRTRNFARPGCCGSNQRSWMDALCSAADVDVSDGTIAARLNLRGRYTFLGFAARFIAGAWASSEGIFLLTGWARSQGRIGELSVSPCHLRAKDYAEGRTGCCQAAAEPLVGRGAAPPASVRVKVQQPSLGEPGRGARAAPQGCHGSGLQADPTWDTKKLYESDHRSWASRPGSCPCTGLGVDQPGN